MVQASARHLAVMSLLQGLSGFAVVSVCCQWLLRLPGAGTGAGESSVIAFIHIAL